MNACGAHFTPPDEPPPVSFAARPPQSAFPPPPSDTSSPPWRPPPHICDIAVDSHTGPRYIVTNYQFPKSNAKSPLPCHQYRQGHPVYPSPPLTDAALASTVPLPDVYEDLSLQQVYASDREQIVNENMSRDGARHIAPLSPPPTILVDTKELPHGDEFHVDHRIEAWRYEAVLRDGGSRAPLFPPVRDDSGFEEYGVHEGNPHYPKPNGSHESNTPIEPSSAWILHSPLSIDEGLPPHLPSLDAVLSSNAFGDRSSGHTDASVSPISVANADNRPGSWTSVSREGLGLEGSADPHFDDNSLIESNSGYRYPHSPLNIDEAGHPSLHGVLSSLGSHQSNGPVDALISPVSISDEDSCSDTWVSGSDMDWSPCSTFADDLSAPPSPKPGGLSLTLSDLDSPLGFQPQPYLRSQTTSLSAFDIPYGQRDSLWFSGNSYGQPSGQQCFPIQPTSHVDDHGPFGPDFHTLLLRSPPSNLDTEYPDTVMPSEDDDDDDRTLLPSPRRRPLNDLHDAPLPHGDVCLTPVPRSPHSSLLSLPDLDMDEPPPHSPHSPHCALPQLDGAELPPLFANADPPVDTISPSLLGGAPEPEPHAGLGLFLQSDPPLARSPSPDDDDLAFLDVQLDPESTHLEVDEFLYLRALRKNALAQERAARMAEADLNERITAAASAFFPPLHTDAPYADADAMQTDDVAEKRMRKRELHAMMDARAEARRTRKLQKQRSKEIGALLDFKMHTPMSPMEGLPPLVGGSKGWTRGIAHLVANMVMRRRDRARPLENKLPPAADARTHIVSGLRSSLSVEDLLPCEDDVAMPVSLCADDEEEDDDMEM